MRCPRCTFPLSASAHGGTEVDRCRRCGGLFLDPGEASRLLGVEAEPSSWQGSPEVVRARSTSRLRCPRDGQVLTAYSLQWEDQPLEVDVCGRCKGLWLDGRESSHLRAMMSRAGEAGALGGRRPGTMSYIFQLLTGMPIEVWNPVIRRPLLVYGLIALLVTLFVLELGSLSGPGDGIIGLLALVPARVLEGRQLWTLLTHSLLHGGIYHLVSNLYFLYIFGDNVEDSLGRGRFLSLYLAATLAGGLLHTAFHPGSTIPMLGASGAISGLMGAYMVLFPHVKVWVVFFFIRFKLAMTAYLVIWVGLQILGWQTGQQNVAWFAHLGGFAAGAGMGLMYRKRI